MFIKFCEFIIFNDLISTILYLRLKNAKTMNRDKKW